MLEQFLTDEQKERSKKFNLFIKRVKEEITDKNDKLKQMNNFWGKDPKPLHELIDSVNNIYFFDNIYDIPTNTQRQVRKIYDSIFDKK